MEAFSRMIPAQLLTRVISQIFHPSAMCQVCLSEKNEPSDFIITCQICRDSIHQLHYGSQLLHGVDDKWICERCTFFINKRPQQPIKCKYCPNTRGIMKQMTFQIKDEKQKERERVWVHPACGSWQYPRNYFKCKKRQNLTRDNPKTETGKYWVNQQGTTQCDVCKLSYGFPLKCKYRDCKKFYHVQCGKLLGVIREMQKTKVQNTLNYIPIYCRQHIEKRINDFKQKNRIENQRGDYDQGYHFLKLAKIFEKQLKQLQRFAAKYQRQEKLRSEFINHYKNTIQQQQQPLLNSVSGSNKTEHSQSFYDFLQTLRPHQDDQQSKEMLSSFQKNICRKKNYVIGAKSSQNIIYNLEKQQSVGQLMQIQESMNELAKIQLQSRKDVKNTKSNPIKTTHKPQQMEIENEQHRQQSIYQHTNKFDKKTNKINEQDYQDVKQQKLEEQQMNVQQPQQQQDINEYKSGQEYR